MDTGGVKYPDLGAVLAREMGRVDSKVPDYVTFYTQTEGRSYRARRERLLGFALRPDGTDDQQHPRIHPQARWRRPKSTTCNGPNCAIFSSKEFAKGRQSDTLGSHNQAYERVRGIMASEKLFDINQEPQKVRDKYGKTQFGEQCLIARRLVEAGVPFVRVARAWWDSATGRTSKRTKKWCRNSTT